MPVCLVLLHRLAGSRDNDEGTVLGFGVQGLWDLTEWKSAWFSVISFAKVMNDAYAIIQFKPHWLTLTFVKSARSGLD